MTDTELRSMKLLWDVYLEAADRLTKVFASGLYLICGFDKVCDEEDASLYIYASELVEGYCDCPVGDYLDFKDANEAVDSFIDSMSWLNVYEIQERRPFLLRLIEFAICYEFGPYITDYDSYNPDNFEDLHGLIPFMGSYVEGLTPGDVKEIAADAFLRMKEVLIETGVAKV